MKNLLFLTLLFSVFLPLSAQNSLTVMPYVSQGTSQNMILQVLSVRDQGQNTPKDVVIKLMDKDGNPLSGSCFSFFASNDRENQMERIFARKTKKAGEYSFRWMPAVEKGTYTLWVESREQRPQPPKLTMPTDNLKKRDKKDVDKSRENDKKGSKRSAEVKSKMKPRASEFVGTTLVVLSL